VSHWDDPPPEYILSNLRKLERIFNGKKVRDVYNFISSTSLDHLIEKQVFTHVYTNEYGFKQYALTEMGSYLVAKGLRYQHIIEQRNFENLVYFYREELRYIRENHNADVLSDDIKRKLRIKGLVNYKRLNIRESVVSYRLTPRCANILKMLEFQDR